MNEGVRQMQESVEDDYNEVLRVFNYGDKKSAAKLNPKMDRTIKKASIGIQKNSMYFGGKEYIYWVRQSYLMMGQAHFYKQDYTSARRVFDYVAKEYEDFPIRFEGYLWLAKVYIQTERYQKAEATLNFLQSRIDESDFPASVKRDMVLVYADFYIAQKDYYAAYPYLERALEMGNESDLITRTQFILAQINQQEGDLKAATEYYKKVINRNPDYKMDFQARINLAKSYDEGTGDSKNIYKLLNKMVKDFRNKEFLDQIYFALAEIAFKEDDEKQGIEYLKKSVSTSTNNTAQKTKSALQLAEIYFSEKDYINSQAYYDTVVQFLPTDYPNAERIKNKAAVLDDLITYVQTIELQDSLQNLATMDSTKLYALIDKTIASYQKEKKRQEEEAAYGTNDGGAQFVSMGRTTTSQTAGGKWYFYNLTAKSQGYSEFIKKWGNRKLEDNWFLLDKSAIISTGLDGNELETEVAANDSITSVVATSSDPESRAYYLASIPRTPEQLQASTQSIIDAYHDMGYLYLEELNDTANALDTYLTFQERYPENQYRLESWYALYKIYTEADNYENADYYKNLIVTTFPESSYAKVILDPDYFIKRNEQDSEAAKLYSKTYEAYNKGQYFRVINYAETAQEDFKSDSLLMPKFMYLKALATGKVETPESLYFAIDTLIAMYPKSDIIPSAKEVLKVLQQEYNLGTPYVENSTLTDDERIAMNLFNYRADVMHLVIMVLNNGNVEVEPLKVRMSDFKKKYFEPKVLRIKGLMLDNKRAIITVGNFENATEASNFLLALENDEYVLSGLQIDDYELFTISVANYPILYREKNVDAYKAFYKEYYSDY